MRLVIASCSVDYSGRLDAHLPRATRVLMLKADGSVLIHSDGGSYKPLNWMSAPARLAVTEPDEESAADGVREVWEVSAAKTDDRLVIRIFETISDVSHELGVDPGLTKDGVEAHLQELKVAGELLDAVDPADALDLHGHGAALGVLGHDVDRADGGGELAAHQAVAGAQDLDLLGQELLEVGLDAVLGEPGVHAQLVADVGDGLEEADDEAVVGLGGADLPDLAHAVGGGLLVRLGDREAGRGAHPVQGLVGAAVGVDEDRAVGLEHEHAGGPGQMGVQTAGVVDGAGGNNEAHPPTLAGRARPRRDTGAGGPEHRVTRGVPLHCPCTASAPDRTSCLGHDPGPGDAASGDGGTLRRRRERTS